MEQQAHHIFKAFSDKTRLQILLLLADGERCVCDIVEALKLPQSKISRHLAYLRRTGVVSVRKEGLWCHYSLLGGSGSLQSRLVGCVRECLGKHPEFRQAANSLAKSKRASCA